MNVFDLNSIKSELATEAYFKSEELIAEYMCLLERGYCIQIGMSYGKDSSVVTNAATEAMKRSISLGVIESDHPLVIINVDTLLEPESTQMYAAWSSFILSSYCDKSGINLHYRTVSPPIPHQFMVLYAGAQKLPASAASGRSMDCSIIWKIDTSIRALREIKAALPLKYRSGVWVSVSGSRSDESTRRSNNMLKQQVRAVKAEQLIERISKDDPIKRSGKVYRFAPISDWSAPDVFNYLNHAGSNSMLETAVGNRIAAYDQNFGLLIAIYGEATNDVCEIVADDVEKKAQQTGCGKIARFGCSLCLAVSTNHSANEAVKHPRWGRFGEGMTRFRDYIQRISLGVENRAFHARALDPVCNNNVFLQPNTLKAKNLEKMVWFASQITQDFKKIHEDFVSAHERGETHLDVGIVDIQNDSSLTASVKAQYIAMYTKRLMAKPMYEMFTDKHAVMLSLLWSLHGVTALPFRPVAILDSVRNGKRLPYPKTNKELNNHLGSLGLQAWDHKSVLNSEFPDALCAQLFTPATKSFSELKALHGDKLSAEHLQQLLPFSLYELWSSKDGQYGGLLDAATFAPNTVAKETRKFSLSYEINTRTNVEKIKAKDVKSGKVINLTGDKWLREQLLELGRNDFYSYLEKKATSMMDVDEIIAHQQAEKKAFGVTCMHEFGGQSSYTSDIVFIGSKLRKKAEAGKNFSQRKRVFSKRTESYTAGRSSLRTYEVSSTPELENQSSQEINYWLPDFAVTRHTNVDVHSDADLCPTDAASSLVFDDAVFADWLSIGGWSNLLSMHNDAYRAARSKGVSMRTYHGTQAVYHLTNNTGLTATAKFEPYLLKTLKRTEIYFKAGLFFLANKSVEEIKSMSNVVTMTEHRKQKTQHLLAVRHLRNSRRSLIKSKMALHSSATKVAGQAVNNVTGRFSEFLVQYEQIAKSYITSAFYAQLCQVSEAELRMNKINIWMKEFSKVVDSVEGALAVLATKDEVKLINSCYDSKQAIASLFIDGVSGLTAKLSTFSAEQKANLSGIKDIVVGGAEFDVVDGEVSHTELNGLIVDVADTVAKHHALSNRFLVAYHLVSRIQSLAGKPNEGFALSVSSRDTNCVEKVEARRTNVLNGMDKAIKGLSLGQHGCFKALLKAASCNAATHKRKALSGVSIESTTMMLSANMSSQLDLIAQLRAS